MSSHDRREPITNMLRLRLGAVVIAGSLALAACSGGATSDLQKNPWQWSAATSTVPASQTVVPKPELYTLTFASDGSVSIKADCNTIKGTYTVNGSALTINSAGPSTRVACGPDSLDSVFLAGLAQVASYKTGSSPALTLQFAKDAGTMQFNAGK